MPGPSGQDVTQLLATNDSPFFLLNSRSQHGGYLWIPCFLVWALLLHHGLSLYCVPCHKAAILMAWKPMAPKVLPVTPSF